MNVKDQAEQIDENLGEVHCAPSFEKELEHLINEHSKENESDTPDFILAEYISDCLKIFGKTTRTRDKWWGFKPWEPTPTVSAPVSAPAVAPTFEFKNDSTTTIDSVPEDFKLIAGGTGKLASFDKNKKEPRLIFNTVVNGEVCGVYSREEEHKLGEWNHCPTNWWLKDTDGEWVPWIDNGANRPCFEFIIKQGNYTKFKWGETQISSTNSVEIYINKRLVYTFGCGNIDYALARVQTLRIKMLEHPFNFANPDEEIGRKVWYRKQPAVIERLLLDQGCVILKKADGTGFDMKDPWDEKDWISEWDGENEVKDDIFTESIWWFRD